jgi:8-amino-7-oxononanoate synthase
VNPFDNDLQRRLEALRAQNLRRELHRVDSPPGPRLQMDGRTLLNFASNDYLGLANQPLLKEAAIRAVEKFGAGSGASRLVCGSLAPHHALEETLASFKGAKAALAFSSGYATAIGTIGALLGNDDIIILDKLVHACIVDAARLSGAKIRVFAHNNLNDLEDKLIWANEKNIQHRKRILIVTESVFSMDGDAAPLREIVALKEKYGAWLMVDEAHATGLYGKHRRGLAEAAGVGDRIEIQMGTLGKAVGAAGGYVCGSRTLIDCLIHRARSFIFSTAPVPAAAAAAAAGIRFIQSPAGARRQQQLFERIGDFAPHSALPSFTRCLRRAGRTPHFKSAILPIIIGDEAAAVAIAAALRKRGIFVPAIRYPTVARGRARLRVTLTAAHTSDDVSRLASALDSIRRPHSALRNE